MRLRFAGWILSLVLGLIGLLGAAWVWAAPVCLQQDDFEDSDLAAVDGGLTGGLSWTSQGTVRTGTSSSWPDKLLQLSVGSRVLSVQTIAVPEFTLTLDAINWYRTPSQVQFFYLDAANFYYFAPNSGAVYRVMNGVSQKLTQDLDERYLIMPRLNPSKNNYKIYFKNSGGQIQIQVDKDGYANGVDYEFGYADTDPTAIVRFVANARIGLTEEGTGTYSYWVNYDNLQVFTEKLTATLPRGATTLYVDRSAGQDAYPGSSAQPLATIQKAMDLSLPGDVVLVRNGRYDEDLAFQPYDKIYATPDKRLTLQTVTARQARIAGINLQYGDYVTVEGFEVTPRMVVIGGSRGVQVLNNFIHDGPGLSGIIANGVGGTVAGNYITRTNKGIVVSGNDMLVENNEIERLIYLNQDADYFRFFGEGHIIRGNYLHGTRSEEIGPSHTDGFQTFDNNGEYAQHIIIENNFMEDFYAQGFMGEAEYHYNSYDLTFRNNIFKDAGAWGLCISSIRDVKVYNNIFINMKIHGVGFSYGDAAKPATGEVMNNIFYDGGSRYWGATGTTVVSGKNLLFSTKDPITASNYPNDLVNQNPLFMNSQANDFRLHPASPAVDTGVDLSAHFTLDRADVTRPQGAGWEIGPYELIPSSAPVAYIQARDGFGNLSVDGFDPYRLHLDGSLSFVPPGRTIVEYRWNFGDGTAESLEVNPDHAFTAGLYKVRLSIRDDLGQTDTDERTVTVAHSSYPNVYLLIKADNEYLDHSGKNHTVAWNGTPAYAAGRFGQAARFDQTLSRALNVAHQDDLDGWEKFTLAFWAKKFDPAQSETVVHKHIVYSYALIPGGLKINYLMNDHGESASLTYTQGPADALWHHYAITYDGARVVFYLDGHEAALVPFSGRIKRDRTRNVTLGRDPWGDSVNGALDEIVLFDIALGPDEIRALTTQALVPADSAPPGSSAAVRVPWVYPNPGRDWVTFSFPPSHAGQTEIKVFNLAGRMVKKISDSVPPISGELKYDLSDLGKGIYFYVVYQNGKFLSKGKLALVR